MKNQNLITNAEVERIAEVMKQAQDRLSQISSYFIQNAFIAQNLVSNIPKEIFEKVAESQKRMTEAFSKINFSHVSQAIASISNSFTEAHRRLIQQSVEPLKRIKYTIEAIEEANEVLISLGWWIYPDWTLPSLKEIVQKHKAGKDSEIKQDIIEYFNSKRINQILTNWGSNGKLSHRMHILKDAIWVHRTGKYTLSVPALLLNVEGVINENSGRTGYIKHPECVTILQEYMNGNFKHGLISSLYPLAIFKFAKSLYEKSFEWGKPSQEGRHPIFHGHFVNYDKEDFSLKLILLLDFIQSILK